MPLRNAQPLKFMPHSVCDAVDGTNAQPGSMRACQDLIPAQHTRGVWVPRPASLLYQDFTGFQRPIRGEALEIIGNKIYGFVASQRFPGHSEPFVYELTTPDPFLPIQGVTQQNTPVSAAPDGDWTPPTITQVGAYILFTHPGFQYPQAAFGWLDMTGLNDSATGSVGASPQHDLWGGGIWGKSLWGALQPGGGTGVVNLSKNIQQAGWRPGMQIRDSLGLIPMGTRIVSVSNDGTSLILSQSSTGAASLDTLSVAGGTPQQPLWWAGNTDIHPLVDKATAVANFNGRAWYAVGSAVQFSDALDPLTSSWATAPQVLTFDNGLMVTAFATVPLTTTQGVVAQNLLCFQADEAIQSITGDQATSNLNKNLISFIGTLAPNAIVSTPQGVLYVAPDGLRVVQQTGEVSDPIGANGDGVALPFINAIFPSRMCAAYNEDIIRISASYHDSVGGSAVSTIKSAEFWFHLKLKSWSGPHSFPASLIAASNQADPWHGFLLFPLDPNANPGLWFSTSRPRLGDQYIENGNKMSWVYATSLFPDTEQMFMNAMNETMAMVSLPPPLALDVSFLTEADTVLDHLQISGAAPPASRWGMALWGAGRWTGAEPPDAVWGAAIWGASFWGVVATTAALLSQRALPWDHELVFKQGRLVIAGPSAAGIAIGNFYGRYQITGYTITDMANVSE